jgi:hypothetical protein
VLQHIWSHQYIDQDRLRTFDGLIVSVLNAGRISLDAGPDIRSCHIKIDGVSFYGDIEIHRRAPEWYRHGHDVDPRYNSVILHVVLDPPDTGFCTQCASGRIIPILVLENVLVDSLDALSRNVLFDHRDLLVGRLPCSGQQTTVPEPLLIRWLDALALERLEIKIRRLDERLRELAAGAGSRKDVWEQVLYEGCMEGLGYSKNRVPFLRLSQHLPLNLIRRYAPDSYQVEALLFGAAGLLPRTCDAEDPEARTYIHTLRREWHGQTKQRHLTKLATSDWVLSPARPANAPVARLVAARGLIMKLLEGDLFHSMLQLFRDNAPHTRESLHALLTVVPGPFWERRISFTRVIAGRPSPLGPDRRDDLIVNVLGPLFLLYARHFRHTRLQSHIAGFLQSFPPTQSNRITRSIERHLMHGDVSLDSSSRQQAALQLFHYYCNDGGCGNCAVGRYLWR